MPLWFIFLAVILLWLSLERLLLFSFFSKHLQKVSSLWLYGVRVVFIIGFVLLFSSNQWKVNNIPKLPFAKIIEEGELKDDVILSFKKIHQDDKIFSSLIRDEEKFTLGEGTFILESANNEWYVLEKKIELKMKRWENITWVNPYFTDKLREGLVTSTEKLIQELKSKNDSSYYVSDKRVEKDGYLMNPKNNASFIKAGDVLIFNSSWVKFNYDVHIFLKKNDEFDYGRANIESTGRYRIFRIRSSRIIEEAMKDFKIIKKNGELDFLFDDLKNHIGNSKYIQLHRVH